MARELDGYRRQLEDILEFFGGARMLTLGQVRIYTGINDYRTLKRRFPFEGRYISATALAHAMCRGEVET
jgi:hypothetical protein